MQRHLASTTFHPMLVSSRTNKVSIFKNTAHSVVRQLAHVIQHITSCYHYVTCYIILPLLWSKYKVSKIFARDCRSPQIVLGNV